MDALTGAAGWLAAAALAAAGWRERRLRFQAERALMEANRRHREAERTILQIQDAHAQAAKRAGTDALTGLANRAVFRERLASWPPGCDATLILLDLDHFKRLNDTRGHQAGDEALKGLARLLRACLRPSDLPFRYGGEEFGVLLAPGTGVEEAARVAERIRAEAEKVLPCTLSAGVACGAPDPDALVQAADAGLYEAKARGRNQVVVGGGGEGGTVPALRDERGMVVSVFLATLGILLMTLVAVSVDFGRMRLHRDELRQAADAAALAGAVGGALVRTDARGRVYSVRLDPTAARQAALEAFWLNAGASRAARLMGTVQADAWVDPQDPTAVVVSVQASGGTPFAALFGRNQQGITLTARAKGVPR